LGAIFKSSLIEQKDMITQKNYKELFKESKEKKKEGLFHV
jgi:hypothetical protein